MFELTTGADALGLQSVAEMAQLGRRHGAAAAPQERVPHHAERLSQRPRHPEHPERVRRFLSRQPSPNFDGWHRVPIDGTRAPRSKQRSGRRATLNSHVRKGIHQMFELTGAEVIGLQSVAETAQLRRRGGHGGGGSYRKNVCLITLNGSAQRPLDPEHPERVRRLLSSLTAGLAPGLVPDASRLLFFRLSDFSATPTRLLPGTAGPKGLLPERTPSWTHPAPEGCAPLWHDDRFPPWCGWPGEPTAAAWPPSSSPASSRPPPPSAPS